MRNVLFGGVVITFSLVLGVFFLRVQRPPQQPASSQRCQPETVQDLATAACNHAQVRIKIGDNELLVEVVSTPSSIQQGLSDRTEIGSDGMLFAFAQPNQPTFWMKDMRFPLDFIWFNDQGSVVQINENIPQPSSAAADPVRVSPAQPIQFVLEVPAGFIETTEISTFLMLTL